MAPWRLRLAPTSAACCAGGSRVSIDSGSSASSCACTGLSACGGAFCSRSRRSRCSVRSRSRWRLSRASSAAGDMVWHRPSMRGIREGRRSSASEGERDLRRRGGERRRGDREDDGERRRRSRRSSSDGERRARLSLRWRRSAESSRRCRFFFFSLCSLRSRPSRERRSDGMGGDLAVELVAGAELPRRVCAELPGRVG